MTNQGKYEVLYQEGPNVCGSPFPAFVRFFNRLERRNCRVLDLGCGQGRDALFIARQGHSVVGVDLAPTGIAQMLTDAGKEELDITGIVDDIVAFTPDSDFDIVLLDRTLHMLPNDGDRRAVVKRGLQHLAPGGYLLIADEPKHKRLLTDLLDENQDDCTYTIDSSGFIYAQMLAEKPTQM